MFRICFLIAALLVSTTCLATGSFGQDTAPLQETPAASDAVLDPIADPVASPTFDSSNTTETESDAVVTAENVPAVVDNYPFIVLGVGIATVLGLIISLNKRTPPM